MKTNSIKRNLFRLSLMTGALLVSSAAWGGYGNQPPPTQPGDPIPGLTPDELALFNAGKAAFEHVYTPQEGVGPLFNARSCVTCHFNPVTGGGDNSNVNNVTHFMLNNNDNYLNLFERGGPVVQKNSLAGDPATPQCTISGDVVPNLPGVGVSIRNTPPVFGFGLIDAIQDDEILKFQGHKNSKDPSVVGTANWDVEMEGLVQVAAFTLDTTRTQPAGPLRVGRFGWKSQTGTLFRFSAEPFNIELGVTTPFFKRENTPDDKPPPPECQVATAKPNDTNNQTSLELYYFQAFLAPINPLPDNHDIREGKKIFKNIGCTDCHREKLHTVSDYYIPLQDGTIHRVDALSDKDLFPWSDFLLHDMGPNLAVGDTRVMGRASPRFWRTTPLWGIHLKTQFLHNGSAATIDQAIEAHGGEGTASEQLYENLSAQDQARLLAFIGSL
jgi:CxxC motif-containing protein (DUF1111 family)